MSSDHFDALNYQISRQKALSAHIDNLANGTDAGFKRMPQPRTDTGVANAYVITITDAPTVYDGYVVIFKPTNTNTAASTINGVPITTDDGTALSGGELQAGHYYQLTYNGGNYEIVSSSIPAGSITEDKMELNGTRADGYGWFWNLAAGKMEWKANGSGSDTGEVRMSSAASPMAFLGDVISDGLVVSSGNLESTGEIKVVNSSSTINYIGDVLGGGLYVNSSEELVAIFNENLFINPEGTVDQIGDYSGTASSGTAIASGSYGLDCWKSFVNGSILTCDGVGSFAISGTGAIFGQYNDDLALRNGESVTISCATGTVEVLAGAGASATTVAPGTPYTFTLSMATTSNFVKLGEGTSCTGLKIEAGTLASSAKRRSIIDEVRLCYTYFQPILYNGSVLNIFAYNDVLGGVTQNALEIIEINLKVPVSYNTRFLATDYYMATPTANSKNVNVMYYVNTSGFATSSNNLETAYLFSLDLTSLSVVKFTRTISSTLPRMCNGIYYDPDTANVNYPVFLDARP